MVAARKGRVGIVRRLIQRGASTNITNKVTMETSPIANVIVSFRAILEK